MARSFTLSLAAVDVLAQLLGITCRHYPFEIPSVGQTAEDRTRIAKAVFAHLAQRGLLGPDGLDRRVERALRLAADANAGIAIAGSPTPGALLRARAAARGDSGVLAVQDGQSVRFDLVGATGLARAMVALLPPAAAGPGQSVHITAPAPEPEREGFARPVRPPRTAAQTHLRLATSILERPRTGFGFFTFSTGDTLGWIDTDAGRYLTLARPDRGATYAPADTARLTRQLDELIQSARLPATTR
ncbi:ESX secretion-associated protein EspG [Actinokineospora sp. NPDC004072]